MACSTANSAIDGVPAGSTAALIKGAVPTFSAASTSHLGARIALFDGSATPDGYLTARQATLAFTAKPVAIAADAATAAGAANSFPLLDSGTTLDVGCGACARFVIAGSNQDGAVRATMAVTANVWKNDGGKDFGLAPTSEPPPSLPRPPSPTSV